MGNNTGRKRFTGVWRYIVGSIALVFLLFTGSSFINVSTNGPYSVSTIEMNGVHVAEFDLEADAFPILSIGSDFPPNEIVLEKCQPFDLMTVKGDLFAASAVAADARDACDGDIVHRVQIIDPIISISLLRFGVASYVSMSFPVEQQQRVSPHGSNPATQAWISGIAAFANAVILLLVVLSLLRPRTST